MSTVTFASVHGENVNGVFYEHTLHYLSQQMINECNRLEAALHEATAHIDDKALAEKYRDIANQRRFQNDIVNIRSGPLLSMGRGLLCATFLEQTDSDWLFMIDTDTAFAPEVVEQMVYIAEHSDADIKLLGGVCWLVTFDRHGNVAKRAPNVYKKITTASGDWLVGVEPEELDSPGVVRVGGVGSGVMLIHRDLLVKIRDEVCGGKAHWWHHLPTPSEPDPEILEIVRPAAERLGVPPELLLSDQFGEDTSFCRRVDAVGEGIYVHPRLSFGHAKSIMAYAEGVA